jgi:hypothetical protein
VPLAGERERTGLRAPSGVPDALLDLSGRDDRGLVVDLGGVLIEGGGGLSAQVAIPEIEVEGADAVRAADAGELQASHDSLGRVISHGWIVTRRWRGDGALWSGGQRNGNRTLLTTKFRRHLAC